MQSLRTCRQWRKMASENIFLKEILEEKLLWHKIKRGEVKQRKNNEKIDINEAKFYIFIIFKIIIDWFEREKKKGGAGEWMCSWGL